MIAEGIGIVEDTRDFLADNRDDSFINRKSNGRRRKCVTLFLKDIKEGYAERLKEGMFGCPTYLLLLVTKSKYIFSFFQRQKHYRDDYGEYWHYVGLSSPSCILIYSVHIFFSFFCRYHQGYFLCKLDKRVYST